MFRSFSSSLLEKHRPISSRHGRTCSGHPRLCFRKSKTWITGTSGAKTALRAFCPVMTVCVGSNIGEAWRALVDVGADRLELIGATHQFHLLDRFSQ
jgi:hypothetical protein